jgi:hypothetical protein
LIFFSATAPARKPFKPAGNADAWPFKFQFSQVSAVRSLLMFFAVDHRFAFGFGLFWIDAQSSEFS